MTDYSRVYNKSTGDTVVASDFNTEFESIATASATKANKTGAPATTNNLAMLDSTGDIQDSLVETDGAGTITADITGNSTTVTTNANLTGDVTSVGNATTIAAGAVDQTALATSSVGQGELKTALQQATGAAATNIAYTGGAYSLMAGVRGNTIVCNGYTLTGYVWGINMGGTGTYYFQSTYVQASPPYNLGDGDIPLFIDAVVDNSTGLITSVSTAPDPVWANNGKTNTRPDYYRDGKGYQVFKPITREIATLQPKERAAAMRGVLEEEREVTQAIKNADMNDVPHVFMGNELIDSTKILLDPVSDCVLELKELRDEGEDINQIIMDGYLSIGNTDIGRKSPIGILTPSVNWK